MAVDFYKGTIPVLDYDTPMGRDMAHPRGACYGLVPRDYAVDPPEMFDAPSGMKIIPESDWDAIYDEQEAQQSSLEHLYLSGPGGTPAFENLDQNGHGDCWAFSTGHALMLMRLLMGQPPVRLNPHATAVMLNQLNGGWCGLSAKHAREVGMAEEGDGPGQWPGHTRSRSYITDELKANMARYKTTEEWVDLTRAVYDQGLTKAQYTTALQCRLPSPSDYNHWSHSVCAIRWVRIERGSWGELILNSWPRWGRYGLAVMRGSKSIPNGALSVRNVRAA